LNRFFRREEERYKEGSGIVRAADGRKEWWKDGVLHREDGPAVVWADGTQEWWVNGKGIRYEPAF